MMSQSNHVQRWLNRLKSGESTDSTVVDALLKIQPVSKKRSGIFEICKNDGIKCLLSLIKRPSRKILDISCSVLANCLTEEVARKEVSEIGAIPSIVKVLQVLKISHLGIITRICRCIANLANNPECAKTIHAIGTVKHLTKVINDPSSSFNCVNSGIRAIKNLSSTPALRKKLIQQGCVTAIAKHLNSDSEDVINSAVQALLAISRSCTVEFADHMVASEGRPIEYLVKIISGNAEKRLKNDALTIIINLTLQGYARPVIGNAGALKCIVDEIRVKLEERKSYPSNSSELGDNSFRLVGSLCYCCREAINRAKLRSLDALPMLVELLSDSYWSPVHSFILTTLLCFVYDEEGLNILHENGIFPVLLRCLAEFTRQEMLTFEAERESKGENETATIASPTSNQIWDGHDMDEEEKFDRRHSLSCDLPTKFNTRPIMLEEVPTDNPLSVFELDWRAKEVEVPYSPQWSPAGPSPVPEDEDNFQSIPSLLASRRGSGSSVALASEETGIERNEPVLDPDESSNSRDSFDLMNSPALLPISHTFKPIEEFEDRSGTKRVRGESTSSTESASQENAPDIESGDMIQRMKKDLQSVSKRAKFENLKGDDRIRSRSLDNDVAKKKQNDESAGKLSCSSSPSPELLIPETGPQVCNPGFLQFVNDTCSVPPNILKRAGRDVDISSADLPSTSTSTWKQARRNRSFAKGVDQPDEKKIEEGDGLHGGTLDHADSAPTLLKTLSSPAIGSGSKLSKPQPLDLAMADPEPATLDQVIVCLLCHYCEMAEMYVISLAQQESCADSLATYIRCYPRKLYSKLYRIIDRLSLCPECFNDIVTKLLVSSLAASVYTRAMRPRPSITGNEVYCKDCDMEMSTECSKLVNNTWHNFALALSSLYCSNSMRRILTKGSEEETNAGVITMLLLALWYCDSQERIRNAPDSVLKCLIGNLQLILDEDKLSNLCRSLDLENNSSLVFNSGSYALHLLCGISIPESVSGKSEDGVFQEKIDAAPTTSQNSKIMKTVEDQSLMSLFSSSNKIREPSNTAKECKYKIRCAQELTDKILVFTSHQDERKSAQKSQKMVRTRNRKLKSRKEEHASPPNQIKIHTGVLCDKSPMFQAMLRGRYKESSDNQVTIKNVPFDSALYSIHCLYNCDSEKCTEMKSLISKFKKEPNARYSEFLASGEIYPFELSVLKLMDQWLLDRERSTFITENEKFFVDAYIVKDIVSHHTKATNDILESGECTKISQTKAPATPILTQLKVSSKHCSKLSRKDQEGRSHDGLTNSEKTKPETSQQKFHFLAFILNHGLSDLLSLYIKYLLSPCLFEHDYYVHMTVLSKMMIQVEGSTFGSLILKELNSRLERIIAILKTRSDGRSCRSLLF